MSRSIVVVDEELVESPLTPKTGRLKINYHLQLVTRDLQFSSLLFIDSQAFDTQAAIALRREVTVPDFMQSDVDIIDLPVPFLWI